jgi:hypothetical protein
MRCGWLFGLVMLVGCGHKAEVAYTQAARINLGSDVKKVLVVERVGAGNTGESVIDFAEGVLTGEGFEGDADTTSAAIQGLMDTMRTTGRFQVTDVRVGGRGVDQNLFGGTMAPKQVIKMCEKAGCDAIIAIDALDTDTASTITLERDPNFGPEFDGRSDTTLTATFRVYEADGSLRDESRVRTAASSTVNDADSRAAAAAAVAVSPNVQTSLAYEAGAEYGARISPHAVVDIRKLYATGDPQLKEGWKAAKNHDWKAATTAWKAASKSDDPKVAAKAKYNLAVVKERRGNLEGARELAKAASVALDRNRTRDYVVTLNQRIGNRERVDRQMATKSKPAAEGVRAGGER